jgi:hypothetical protein
MKVNLILSNKASDINKKLIKFFNVNLLNFNKANIIFDFEVAHPEDMDNYEKRGIKTYPVLIHKENSVTGTSNIVDYLKSIVSSYNKKILNKSEGEKLDDFWKQTIGKIELDASGNVKPLDEDEDDDGSGDIQHRIQQAFEDRSVSTDFDKSGKKQKQPPPRHQQSSKPKPRSNNLEETPSETLKNMQSKGKNNMDDELMAKFFENQEESI